MGQKVVKDRLNETIAITIHLEMVKYFTFIVCFLRFCPCGHLCHLVNCIWIFSSNIHQQNRSGRSPFLICVHVHVHLIMFNGFWCHTKYWAPIAPTVAPIVVKMGLHDATVHQREWEELLKSLLQDILRHPSN